jgi:hypothetical protein
MPPSFGQPYVARVGRFRSVKNILFLVRAHCRVTDNHLKAKRLRSIHVNDSRTALSFDLVVCGRQKRSIHRVRGEAIAP